MIVGPTKALFMDEISNGLDSSTTFQIVSCLQHLAHIIDATALISLLQPAPETFDLFDDIILMAEGKIVYHDPRTCVLKFFEDCGFKCPDRKGAADFLQEVISSKDQAQYWHKTDQPYSYVSVDQFAKIFKDSHLGHKLDEELSKPSDKSQSHKNALSSRPYSLSKWGLFKACTRREFLPMRRNYFIYVFKSTQVALFSLSGGTQIPEKNAKENQEGSLSIYTSGIIKEIRNLVGDISSKKGQKTNSKEAQESILLEIEKLAAEAYSIFRSSVPTFTEEAVVESEEQKSPVKICSGTGTGFEILCQGFNWESHKSGRWFMELKEKAAELSSIGFTVIWLPPPTESISPEGFMPKDLYNLNSRGKCTNTRGLSIEHGTPEVLNVILTPL
ncbi:hypothetical protein SO802_010933 [Lithocarpus litseifolius]|uniref:ABC transporter family G domain-containing protein n=1 Tax=Lithocarpus litseifolius TaxID=425828 RepID=A0AAW2DG60_9ROSI